MLARSANGVSGACTAPASLATGVESPVPVATPGATAAAAGQPVAAEAEAGGQAAAASEQRAAEAVRAWAAAWESQDVDAYLASYSGAFVPADGSSRSSWESCVRSIASISALKIVVFMS